MISGIGVDVVDIARFRETIARTPALVDRVLTAGERFHRDGSERSVASLAARFAAKEAVAKALGAPAGMSWHDCVIAVDAHGRPQLALTATVAAAAAERGITDWHLSLTHDGGIAIAYVIAEVRT